MTMATGRARRACRILAALLAVSFVPVVQSAAAENERAAQLAAVCAACHRLDGRDTGIPPIVGLDEIKLAGMLAAFKSGARGSQIMHAVALSLSDEEIAAVARHLAAQRAVRP